MINRYNYQPFVQFQNCFRHHKRRFRILTLLGRSWNRWCDCNNIRIASVLTHLLSVKWRRMNFQSARRRREAMRWHRWLTTTWQMEIQTSHLTKCKCVSTLGIRGHEIMPSLVMYSGIWSAPYDNFSGNICWNIMDSRTRIPSKSCLYYSW